MAGARGAAQQTFLVVRAVTARDYSQADLLWLFRFLLLLLFLAIKILYTNLFLFFFVHFSFCFCLVCAAFLAQQVQGNYIFLLNECSLVGFEADVGDWGASLQGRIAFKCAQKLHRPEANRQKSKAFHRQSCFHSIRI